MTKTFSNHGGKTGPLKPGTFSMLPDLIRKNGAIEALSKSGLRVYIEALLRTRWNDGRTFVADQKGLAGILNLSDRRVRSGLRELEQFNLIVRTQDEDRGEG